MSLFSVCTVPVGYSGCELVCHIRDQRLVYSSCIHLIRMITVDSLPRPFKASNELSHCVHIFCFQGIWKTILFISDEVLFNLCFQILQSRSTALSCLDIFVCWFPLQGSAWIEALTLSHHSVGWVPSCFSSDAKSAQWLFFRFEV